MTALIYFVCFFCAAIIQTLLRSLLANGVVPFIPGRLIIYLGAIWAAKKWSSSYKENKEMKKIQEEIASKYSEKPDKGN